MNLVLSEEEQLIKNWEYAEASNKKNKKNFNKTFSVTDRRVILTETDGECTKREEIAIDTIVGYSSDYVIIKENKRKLGIVLIILGIILLAVSICCALMLKKIFWCGLPASLIISGIGIYFLFYKKVYGELRIVLQTNIVGDNLRRSVHAGNASSMLSRSKKRISLCVNIGVANEIVETLGSVILVR